MRWLFAFLFVWLICLFGMTLAWIVGLLIHCGFMSGCYSQLDIETLLRAIDRRSVAIKGTLFSIVIVGMAWVNMRKK